MPGMIPVNYLIVGNGNNHRHSFPFGQQVIKNKIRPSVINPVRREFTASAQQIKNRIFFLRIISGRSVNIEFAFTASYFRIIYMACHCSVRNIPGIIICRPVAMHNQLTVRRHGCKGSISIIRVSNLNAIYIEMVGIHIRFERPYRERPDTIVTLCKRNRFPAKVIGCVDCLDRQNNLLRIGRFQPESNHIVVAHLGRVYRGAERHKVLCILLRIVIEIHVSLLRP